MVLKPWRTWTLWTNRPVPSGIPKEALGALGHLKLLELPDAGLRGTLPPGIGGLGSLARLGLSRNQLSGGLPRRQAVFSNA